MERLSEHDRAVVNAIFDPLQALGSCDFPAEENSDTIEDNKLNDQVLEMVKKAILSAESKNFEESFKLFEEALEAAPRSPSIYNDRAQALRLAGRDEEALQDLDLAVELSGGGKGKSGVQALCQRGALYRSMNKDEKAREDFTLAAKRGSSFAKSQLVALNPYAAMCNAMLREITLKSEYSKS